MFRCCLPKRILSRAERLSIKRAVMLQNSNGAFVVTRRHSTPNEETLIRKSWEVDGVADGANKSSAKRVDETA